MYLRIQKCWDIRPKAPDARRMSAALLGGMQANATRQMGLLGRIEQRWGVFRYTLRRRNGRESGDPPEGVHHVPGEPADLTGYNQIKFALPGVVNHPQKD